MYEQLTKSTKQLSSEVVAQGNQKKRRRSDITTVSRRKQLQSDIQQSLLFLEDEGASATSVTLVHTSPNSPEQVEADNQMKMVLYVKERFGLSSSAYHEMSMVCRELPLSWKLKNLTAKMNTKWNIEPYLGNDGVQQSLESRLKECVSHLLQEGKMKSGNTLQVKLSGDGTKVCRKLNVINFIFTLLNEGEIAMSPKGNHTIAIINSTESYEVLATTLSTLRDKVKRITAVEVDGHTFCIEYFLCSDWPLFAVSSLQQLRMLVFGASAHHERDMTCQRNGLLQIQQRAHIPLPRSLLVAQRQTTQANDSTVHTLPYFLQYLWIM